MDPAAAAAVTVVLWASAFVAIRSAGENFAPGALALRPPARGPAHPRRGVAAQRWWLAGPGSVAQDSGLGAALVRTPGAYVDRMSGLPCIPDTRVTVSAVLGQLAAGRTIEEILVDYPYLDRG
jgi:Protein of unknown function (DUF433)